MSEDAPPPIGLLRGRTWGSTSSGDDDAMMTIDGLDHPTRADEPLSAWRTPTKYYKLRSINTSSR